MREKRRKCTFREKKARQIAGKNAKLSEKREPDIQDVQENLKLTGKKVGNMNRERKLGT
jgi:hypothetical protein